MFFGNVPLLLAAGMVVAPVIMLWLLVRARRVQRTLDDAERGRFRRGIRFALPAVILSSGSVVSMLGSEIAWLSTGRLGVETRVFFVCLFPSFFAMPFALILMLAGYAAYPGGYPAKYVQRDARPAMFHLRLSAFAACVLSMWGTLVAASTWD